MPVTAQTYGIEPGAISWREAAAEVERLRQAYAAAGYRHGHRVGLLLENRPAFLFHWFALNGVGASVVPISAEMRSAELEYLIGHSEICLAVTLPHRGAGSSCGRESGRRAMCGRWSPMRPCRAAPAAPLAFDAPSASSECALLYTSGTTGRPKGCRLSNAYFLRAGEWYAGLGDVCPVRPGRERVITPLPLNHVNAMAFSTMVVLTAGGCLVQLDRFHPKTWWQSVRDSRATIVHYLGVMPAMLLSAPAARGGSRACACAGASAPAWTGKNHAPFEARFGFPLVEAWAMTETGAAACVMANHEPRHVGTSCFGRPEAFVDVRLVDDEGRDVPRRGARRAAGALGRPRPAPPFLQRLPEGRGGDAGGVAGRLVPHRRHGAARRRRQRCTSSTARRT